MKKCLLVLLAAYGIFVGVSASAATYTVLAYTDCETTSGRLQPCPWPLEWHSVDLGALAFLTFDPSDPKQTLKLVDTVGHSWSVALADCRDSFEKAEGCSQENDLSRPDDLALNYSEWKEPDLQYLSVHIIKGNEVRIFVPPREDILYVLSVKKTE